MAAEADGPLLLYVEDELFIQHMLMPALQEAGFQLLVADSGTQALDLLAQNAKLLHGIVTDVNLGHGPDGWEVAQKGRESIHNLPVVYVSAASDHEWLSKGVPNSIMVAKPFVPAQVVVAISSLLTASGQN